jgi:hypothetical protein
LEPYQERVVEEKAALDEKLQKLKEFILQGGLFPTLPLEEQHLMRQQERIMEAYSSVLSMRIDKFAQ